MSSRSPGSALLIVLLAVLVILGGCVALPAAPATTPTYSLDAAPNSPLTTAAIAGQPAASTTGVRLLPSGPEAFEARRSLIRAARNSIDLQYFLLRADGSGKELLRDLRDAAQRGVRVRVLLDDLYAPADDLLLGLAALPQAEVRLFNPFPLRGAGVGARYAASLLSFERFNHRMHNKLFIADGAIAITGGRNLADEYFSRSDRSNFVDLDVMATGAAVRTMGQQFDDYWNSPLSWPVQTVAATPSLSVQQLRERFDVAVAGARTPDAPVSSRDFLGQPLLTDELGSGSIDLAWGHVDSFADPAAKPLKRWRDEDNRSYGKSVVRPNVLELMRAAQFEVVMTSPYFVPGELGVELFRGLVARGVKVRVLTNSQASTDQPLVHGAYRRYRRALLEAGVELYELSPKRVGSEERRKSFGLSAGGLHTKSLVIDRQLAVIGSMNFDPRSDHYNTESGLLIRVPQVGSDAAQLARIAALDGAHRVVLSSRGELRWIDPNSDDHTHEEEPETTVLSRWWLRGLSFFAPESLL